MAFWRLLSTATRKNPNSTICFLTNFIVRSFSKTPKPQKKSSKTPKPLKRSPKRTLQITPIQPESERIPHFENIVLRDKHFHFIIKTKDYLCKQPQQALRLIDANKLYRELGFGRGRKVLKYIQRYPLVFQTCRHSHDIIWFGFTDLMRAFVEEEKMIMDKMEKERIDTVRKLLMMSAKKRIPLTKIYRCRLLFGLPEDFRDRVRNYPKYFNTVVEEDGKTVLELVSWDQNLAVSALEREFMVDEDYIKKAFRFKVKHRDLLDLGVKGEMKLNTLNTLPLVSPYSDGSRLAHWTLEAEKYRVGVIHEFLSLTLEKRATIHHIVEFKEEFSLNNHTYETLLKQPRSFYLAGMVMNYVVFLKDAYGEDGVLIHKDPQILFNEKLFEFVDKQEVKIC